MNYIYFTTIPELNIVQECVDEQCVNGTIYWNMTTNLENTVSCSRTTLTVRVIAAQVVSSP